MFSQKIKLQLNYTFFYIITFYIQILLHYIHIVYIYDFIYDYMCIFSFSQCLLFIKRQSVKIIIVFSRYQAS